jgi:hypothetical protein
MSFILRAVLALLVLSTSWLVQALVVQDTVVSMRVVNGNIVSDAQRSIDVEWTPPVTGVVIRYEIRYKKSTDSVFEAHTVPADVLFTSIHGVTAGSYNIQVEAVFEGGTYATLSALTVGVQ